PKVDPTLSNFHQSAKADTTGLYNSNDAKSNWSKLNSASNREPRYPSVPCSTPTTSVPRFSPRTSVPGSSPGTALSSRLQPRLPPREAALPLIPLPRREGPGEGLLCPLDRGGN